MAGSNLLCPKQGLGWGKTLLALRVEVVVVVDSHSHQSWDFGLLVCRGG